MCVLFDRNHPSFKFGEINPQFSNLRLYGLKFSIYVRPTQHSDSENRHQNRRDPNNTTQFNSVHAVFIA